MISNKEAVKAVVKYMMDMSEFMPNSERRLEELAYDADEKSWVVSVSFKEHSLSDEPRIYRRFFVDADSAEVKSMARLRED